MKLALFCQSIVSDWNHGNAHFLRGVVRELKSMGCSVRVLEPRESWCVQGLLQHEGSKSLRELARACGRRASHRYRWTDDLDALLQDANVVLVHEWTDPRMIHRLAEHHAARRNFLLLYHDTHHRCVSDPASLESLPWDAFDAVLAFGESLAHAYRSRGLHPHVHTWHEAADTARFKPLRAAQSADLVFIGNGGDGERTQELRDFLIQPVMQLGLRATVHGVRYSPDQQRELASAGIELKGWLPNHRAPLVYAQHRLTVHIPRQPYTLALPGVPTIRPFEAMACALPLVIARWRDAEHLFNPQHLRLADTPLDMVMHLRELLQHPDAAKCEAEASREHLLAHHTCRHRACELIQLCKRLTLASRNPKEVSHA